MEQHQGSQADVNPETLILGGGCFWCTEAVFSPLRGVLQVVPGYMGGHVDDPRYEAVCSGDTGHAEVVQVVYDPQRIGTEQLLEVFFATHDPTTLDRQGADVGSQYRSAVFTTTEAQRETALRVIEKLQGGGPGAARSTDGAVFDRPIVTTVQPATRFWPAEEYHHRYFERNPGQGYCSVVISPKVAGLRRRFAALLTQPRSADYP